MGGEGWGWKGQMGGVGKGTAGERVVGRSGWDCAFVFSKVLSSSGQNEKWGGGGPEGQWETRACLRGFTHTQATGWNIVKVTAGGMCGVWPLCEMGQDVRMPPACSRHPQPRMPGCSKMSECPQGGRAPQDVRAPPASRCHIPGVVPWVMPGSSLMALLLPSCPHSSPAPDTQQEQGPWGGPRKLLPSCRGASGRWSCEQGAPV